MEELSLFNDSLIFIEAAIVELRSGLEIVKKCLEREKGRSCIETVKSRIKSGESISAKLEKRGLPVNAASALENLYDIAGVRVICSYIDDVYSVAEMMRKRRDIEIIEEKDYIKNPKPNGYRSYHMILKVPIYVSDETYVVNAELQIRTIAMDCWASLEHAMKYKKDIKSPELIADELKRCADDIASVDINMQAIRDMISEE